MSNLIESLINYGKRVQYGIIQKNEKEMKKKMTNDFDEKDPISLKSYLDTILPPKESTENGQIFMQFVSCTPASASDVVELNKALETQMKVRNAKETGICNNREELYSECFDELIRQVTINSLQRGELLNHVKEQMKETINYYQKLYESSMAFAMRKVLREQQKRKKMEMREQALMNQIETLKQMIAEKEKEIEEKKKNDEEKEKYAQEDHDEMLKNLKFDSQQKLDRVREILTMPKQVITLHKK